MEANITSQLKIVPYEETKDQEQKNDEAVVLAELVEWAADRPAWQQDALRRLATQNDLDEEDIDELLQVAKGIEEGRPITLNDIKDPAAMTDTVILKGIKNAQDVNALADDQVLSFCKSGLTIIYGDNGSGKSGYARILKKACRSRSPKHDEVLPNVYKQNPGIPRAELDYLVNGNACSAQWQHHEVTNPALSAISVFDSATANIHINEANDVAYMPFPMQLLSKLGNNACSSLKGRLNDEVKALENETPATIKNPKCSSNTEVGKTISALNGSTDKDAVELLCVLSEDELTSLEQLKTDLAADPEKTVNRLRRQKSMIEANVFLIQGIRGAVSNEKIENLHQLQNDYAVKRDAATAAAQDLFKKEPLPDIGSEIWKELWEAAREYSEQSAYPDNAFPVTEGNDPRCVLCHQELSDEAAGRLTRFEGFVKDDTKAKESEAKVKRDHVISELRATDIPARNIPHIIDALRAEVGDEDLLQTLRKIIIQAKLRVRLLTDDPSTDLDKFPQIETFPAAEVNRFTQSLTQRIVALESEKDSDQRKRLAQELRGLQDREWLGIVKEDVLAEVDRRGKIEHLKAVLKDTNPSQITAKSTEISERLVTNALRDKFASEIDKLKVSKLRVELQQGKTSYGVPHFKVSLIANPDASVGMVLSEGEQRCIALAAFLAEQATTQSRAALVFDDPVSSLDHNHREAVAERLVGEAKERQVIVFTHHIGFLFWLKEACTAQGVQVSYRCVSRGSGKAGFCHQNPPANAQPVEDVIEGIQKRLDNEKIHHERGNQEQWHLTVRSIKDQLRDTWERSVEKTLSPVVWRFGNKINTKGLAQVTVLKMEDSVTMREAYGRCSRLLHSESFEAGSPLPDPDQIQTEIDTLKNWLDEIKRRQDGVRPK